MCLLDCPRPLASGEPRANNDTTFFGASQLEHRINFIKKSGGSLDEFGAVH
jgi:hypothetical protein